MDIIRLIASDLDATLLDGQSQLPPDFAETVRALAEQGIRFAAASGRDLLLPARWRSADDGMGRCGHERAPHLQSGRSV